MAEAVKNISSIDIESTNEYPTRSGWFSGYEEGNSLMPQKYNILGFTTLAAVLKDPPQKWEAFSFSVLDESQIKKVGRLMTNLHRGKGINVVDKYHYQAESKDEIASDDRLQQFWVIAKNYTLINLLSYIQDPTEEDLDFTSDEAYKKHSQKLDNFFSDPKNQEKIDHLKKIVIATEEGFLSPRGKQLARIYRATYDRKVNEEGFVEVDDDLFDAIENLQQEAPDSPLRGLASREFSKHAREQALNKVPEFRDNDWYTNLPF